jgi:hypothetical protein
VVNTNYNPANPTKMRPNRLTNEDLELGYGYEAVDPLDGYIYSYESAYLIHSPIHPLAAQLAR